RTLARALSELAWAHLALGRDDAADLGRQAVDQLEPVADAALAGARQKVLEGWVTPLTDQLRLAQTLAVLAEGLDRAKRPAEAVDRLRQALERVERVAEQFRGLDVSDIENCHAWVATRLARQLAEPAAGGGGDEALRLLDGAVVRLDALVKARGEIPHYRAALADALSARARAYERAGRTGPAEADAERARSLLEPTPTGEGGPGPLNLM